MARAFSAASGLPYPQEKRNELSRLGFKSDLWLTEKQMRLAGVTLKPDAKGKGYETSYPGGESYTIYNATQTTDHELVESLKGRLISTNALTGEVIGSVFSTVLVHHIGSYPKNEWITEKQIAKLGLKLKKKNRPVKIKIHNVQKQPNNEQKTLGSPHDSFLSYYNIAELENPEVIKKMKTIYPISVATGRIYTQKIAYELLNWAYERNLDSPFWLTQDKAEALGVSIINEKDGIELTLTPHHIRMKLFNASSTSSAKKIASGAYSTKFYPRSALSDAIYPEPTRTALREATLRHKYKSMYWLTYKQATFFGVKIFPGQFGIKTKINDTFVNLFNATQTSNYNKMVKLMSQRYQNIMYD